MPTATRQAILVRERGAVKRRRWSTVQDPYSIAAASRSDGGEIGPFFRLHLAAKAGLAAAQSLGGWLTGSTSLLADGAHNLADLLSGSVAWLGWKIARRPPDTDHHYGHGNAEALSSVIVGLALFGASAAIVWHVAQGGSVVASATHGYVAVTVALSSIVTNELLGRRATRLAEERRSLALRALARDDRADTLSSALVVLAVCASLLGYRALEPIVALAIAAWITWMAWRSLSNGLDVLMDRVSDPALRERVREVALRTPGVHAVQAVRIHPLGTHQRIDMEISVDGTLSVARGHSIAHAVEGAVVSALPEVSEVQVHVNPAPVPGQPTG